MRRPNFLIFMMDQLTGTWFEDGPAPFLHAPNLRRLFDEGAGFARAYCPSPLCVPARASFMSGLLPSVTGVYDNAAEFPASIPTFAHHLRRLGYLTVLSGKMHFVGPDQLHGFEKRLTTDIYPADFGWTPDWSRPDERIDWWYHNLGVVTSAGIAQTSNQLEFDDEVAYHGRWMLYQLARGDRDRPFCLTVSFTHPHDPYVARPRYWDLYRDRAIPDPPGNPIPYVKQDPHSRRLMNMVDWRRFEVEDRHVRAARRAYCANISYVDDLIGGITEVLRDCLLDRDTIIVVTADHGDMLGERGLWFKMSFFEGSMRVPLLFHAPGRLPRARIDTPVSTLDVLPTLVELAGASPPTTLDGVSLAELAAGGAGQRGPVLAEYAAEGAIDPMVMIRDDTFKFTWSEPDPPQLFDLRADPLEQVNLAAEPQFREQLARFERQLGERWDIDAFRAAVHESQARRLLVFDALRHGGYQSWDYEPHQDAANRYMRNHLDLNVLEARARYPRGLEDERR